MIPPAELRQSHGVERSSRRVGMRRAVSRIVRSVRRALAQNDLGCRRTPADLSRAADATIQLGRFFYIFMVFAIASPQIGRAYSGPPTQALWPVDVLDGLVGVGWLANTTAVWSAGIGLCLLAAVFPRVLIWRLGVFLYLLFYIAMSNSYGSVNHGRHVYIYVSFALLFLPGRDKENRSSRKNVLSCLAVLWLTQSVLLLPYTLSGFWRIWRSRLELLSSDGMVRILLNRAVDNTENIGPLLPFVVEHGYLAQTMLWVTVYVEVFALLAVFRPHLHRLFGIALIMFHVGSEWIMSIAFNSNILMLGLFLVLSPTAPRRFSLSGTIRSLPLVGIPVRAWIRLRSSDRGGRVRRAWLIYDGDCPFCSNYARYLRIKDEVDEFVLVDARSGGPLVDEVRNLPHDLDQGMVLKMNGRYYVGHEALNVLALLSDKRGGFNRLNRLLFNSPLVAKFAYPLLRSARWLALKAKGVPPLDP